MNLESFIPQALAQLGMRNDAADTAFFLRQLTYVYNQTYDILYPDLMARKLVPVDTRVDPGAESLVWRQYDKRGQAKVVQNYADDFPNAEVVGKEFQSRILSLGDSYQYTVQDLRAAQMAGLPLSVRKAQAARDVMENLVEQITAFGMNGANGAAPSEAGDTIPCYGWTNFPGITTTMGTNTWCTSTGLAGTATVAQILSDINTAANQIFVQSKGIHRPDTMVLGTAAYGFLASTPRSSTFTEDSIMNFVLKMNPWLKSIECWPYLDLAGLKQDNSTPGPRCIFYKKDPEMLGLILPQEFEQLPPQLVGMSWKIPCHMRFGGVKIHYPKSMLFLDGVTG